MFRLTKRFEFCGSHSLPQLPADHKCHQLHGHNYTVELVIVADKLDVRGFAGVDYADLDSFREYLDKCWDHRNLNDVQGRGEDTTAERLAMTLYGWAKAHFPGVERVRVYETPTTCVEYYPDEPKAYYSPGGDLLKVPAVR